MKRILWFLGASTLVGVFAAVAVAQRGLLAVRPVQPIVVYCSRGFLAEPMQAATQGIDYQCLMTLKPICKNDSYRVVETRWDGTQIRYTCKAPKP